MGTAVHKAFSLRKQEDEEEDLSTSPEARWLREIAATGRDPTVEEMNEAVAMRREGAGLPEYPEELNRFNNPYQDPNVEPSTSQWGQQVIDTAAEPTPDPEAIYPEALPGVNRDDMGAIRDDLYQEAEGYIREDPRFANIRFDGQTGGTATGGGTAAPEKEPTTAVHKTFQRKAPPSTEEERGFFNNTSRVAGQRALNLVGSGIRFIGEVGEDLDEKAGWGKFVWGDGEGFRYMNEADFAELKKHKVSESLFTETLPMAFQDRDLGGVKKHTPEKIKEAWAAGDISGVASSVGKYIAETGIESIPDMIAAVWALPLYIGARSEEVAEERVRNERLSEAIAANPEISEAAQADIATGYVSAEALDSKDIATAAPFAALSALFERIGAKGIGNAGTEIVEQAAKEVADAGMRAVVREGGKAAGKEAATEFFQEGVIEYVGERVGTSQEGTFGNMSVGEGFERGAWGALAGGGAGGVAGTAIAAGRSFMVDQKTGEVDTGTTPPDGTPPDGGQQDFEDTSGDGMSQAEKEALVGQLDQLEESEAAPVQGDLAVPEPPAPTPETATTPTAEKAPVAAGPEPTRPMSSRNKTSQVGGTAPTVAEKQQGKAVSEPGGPMVDLEEEVVTQDDLVTEPAPEVEAAPVETPMIQKKDVEAGFRALAKKTKGGMPGIRKAIQSLGTAIAAVFPDAKKLPGLKGTVGPKRMGEYFAALDEEIKIDETLPNLKEFLQAVYDSPDAASAVQNINRLKEYVANSGAGVVDSGTTIAPTLAGAVQGVTLYDTFEADRAAGVKKYNTKDSKGNTVERTTNRSKQNKPLARAVAIDELATVVKSLLTQASGLGINAAGEINDLIARARSYRKSGEIASTTVSKGGAGSKKTNYEFNRKNLDEVGDKLREAAQTLVEQISAVDTAPQTPASTTTITTVKKPKGKAKPVETSAVTAAPVEPTSGEKAVKTSKAKGEKKLTKKEKESARIKAEMEKGQAELAAAVAKPPSEVDENFDEATEAYIAQLENESYNDLRKQAKQLGVKAVGTKAVLIERIAEEHRKLAKMVADPTSGEYADTGAKPEVKVTVKKSRRIANPDGVIEVAPVGPVLTGRGAANFAEEMDVEGGTGAADRALEAANIPKKTAALVKAIIEKAPRDGRRRIINAIKEYRGPADNLSLIAAVYEAVGGEVAPEAMAELLNFAESQAENKALDPTISAAEEALIEAAAERGMTLADYKTVLQDTGQYVEEADETTDHGSDQFADMSVEEYENSKYQRGVPVIEGHAENNRVLSAALTDPKTGLLGFMSEFMKIEGMPDPGTTNINDLLKAIVKSLPSSHRYSVLAKRLLQLNLDVPVHVHGETLVLEDGTEPLGAYWAGNEYDPGSRKIRLYLGDNIDTRHIFSTALHEIIHAATEAAYNTDPVFRSEIDALYDRASAELDLEFPGWRSADLGSTETWYGMSSPTEFIAEALTNPKFQNWLANIDSTRPNTARPDVTGILRDFFNSIKKLLGYSIRNSLLEDVLLLVDANLQTEEQVQISQQIMQVKYQRAAESLEGILEAFPKVHAKKKSRDQLLDSSRNLKTGIGGVAKRLKQQVSKAGRHVNLAFSNRDVIERGRRDLFDTQSEALGISNPLTAYTKAKAAATELARKYERKGYLMLKRLQALTNSARSELGVHMRDITKANIDPTQPLNSAANAHIWTKKGKLRKAFKDIAPQARSNFLNFQEASPKAAKLLSEMAALTKEIHDTKVRSALYALGEAFEFDATTTQALQRAKTAADIDAIFDPKEVELARSKKDSLKGKKKDLKKALAHAIARAEAAKSAKKILHDSSIKGWYFPLRRYGDFVVSTSSEVVGADRYVSFHTTQAEADSVAAALNKAAGKDGDKVSVSLKLKKSASASDVQSVIGDLASRIKDKATRDRLKGAMAEVLASNAAYQSQLKRANIDGVAADDMARAFEEYVHVSKYTIGDLLVSNKVSRAIQDLNLIAKNAEEDAQMDSDTAVEIGQVVDEIKNQNKADSADRDMSIAQKTVGIIGFLNFLGAPSYWALNATQTYTVTLPYITAKYGKKAPMRLLAAQKQVLAAATAAMASSDKSYEGFKSRLPAGAQKVVAALEAEGVLQSTIAHEFGDMLSPTALNKMREHALGAPVAKTTEFTMQVLEKVPEAVEHYNRISTALVIYEMSGGDITATIDGVQATQFNYDTGNRARLLKTLPGGGGRGIVTPVMMFKTYGIGLARLFYGAIFDIAFKKGGRKEAIKLATGLITSHTLFGGVAGGLMIAPVQMIIAVINATLDPDDEYDLEEGLAMWGEELGGDFLGALIKKGLPTALGVDLSRSINLGNLIWMGNENLDPAKYGDIERGLFQLFGPVAQYGVSSYREGYKWLSGDNDGGFTEFLEAAIPLKAYRGVSQAIRYETEGLETSGKLNMLTPEEFTQIGQTMLGFQSVQKTETQGAYYNDVRLDIKRSGRKSQLVERANDAIAAGNFDKLDDIMKDIIAFNLSVPRPEHRVTGGTMAQLRSRRRSAQREYDRKYRYSN